MWNLTTLGSTLKTGFNFATDWFQPKSGAQAFTSSFFPAAQKSIITGSEVSRAPGGSTQGYRPQAKDAVTLGAPYRSWWGKVSDWGAQLGDTFKHSIMGIPRPTLAGQFKSTVSKVLTTTGQAALSTLPDYFMEKMGLVNRPPTGETTQNAPYQPNYPIIYLNSKQSDAPATQPSALDNLFSFLSNSQPKGSYNIGMPQSAPIPANVVTTEVPQLQAAGGLNLSLVFVLIISAVVLFMFLRRRK